MSDKNTKSKSQSIPDAGNMHVNLEQNADGALFVSSPYTSDDPVQSVSVNFSELLNEQVARLEAAGFQVVKTEDGTALIFVPKLKM